MPILAGIVLLEYSHQLLSTNPIKRNHRPYETNWPDKADRGECPPVENITSDYQKFGGAVSDAEFFLFAHRFTPSPGQSRVHSFSYQSQKLITASLQIIFRLTL
jgi:hypothetical protein